MPMEQISQAGKRKWFPFIIVISLLAFGGICYFVFIENGFKPTPRGTQSTPLKVPSIESTTFTDKQQIISFKYPAGATKIQKESPALARGISFQAYYQKWGEKDSWSMTVMGIPSSQKAITVDEIKSQSTEKSAFSYSDIQEISLDGERAITYMRSSKLPSQTIAAKSRLIEAVHNGMLYSIGWGAYKDTQVTDDAINQAYQLLLGSWKFLK
jgi:hypothetical protein